MSAKRPPGRASRRAASASDPLVELCRSLPGVTVTKRSALPLDFLRDLLADAHSLVGAKLPASTRRRLGLGSAEGPK